MFQKRLDFLQAKTLFFGCFLMPCILGTFCRFIPCNLSRLRLMLDPVSYTGTNGKKKPIPLLRGSYCCA